MEGVFVNGVNFDDLPSKGDLIVEKLNEEEKYFRLVERKVNPKYKNWVVKQTVKRLIIIEGKKYEYNLTIYRDKKTGKSFVYYHNEMLKIKGKKNYLYEDVIRALSTNNLRRRGKNDNEFVKQKVPYDVVYYWKRIRYLDIFIPKKKDIFLAEKKVQIDFDDTFLKVKLNRKVEKMMIRMLALSVKHCETKYLLLNFQSEKLVEKVNYLAENIRQFLPDFDKKSFGINGDGARIINKFAEKINGVRYFDFYHFAKYAYDVFGYSMKRNKDNYKLWQKENDRNCQKYYEFINLILMQKWDLISEFLNKSKTFILKNGSQKQKININKLIKLWKNNEKAIQNNFLSNDYLGSKTECFVGHYIKSKAVKKFANFKIDNLIYRIYFQLPTNIKLQIF
ncbi:Mbov_0401 family ICE element transposase-like protein [Mycoplasmopsis gallinarum]|uniref:Mbov_0401 family ICE element transposase-like protein n=1 Tax=Mycoplasmopsis gallinarum TaxID=29557 RepID=UPI00048423D2|nr:hypothetical protein [Mycoplasmopsis gallinarum]